MRGDAIPFVLPVDGSGDPTTGNATNVPRIADYRAGGESSVKFVLTGAADVSVEMSNDDAAPATWLAVPNMTNITAGTAIVVMPTHNVRWLRCVVNVAVDAGNKVIFAGMNSRTD